MEKISKEVLKQYNNVPATFQVLGCLMQKPEYIREYKISKNYFVGTLSTLAFLCIEHLYSSGAKEINVDVIEEYLQDTPTQLKYFVNHNMKQILLSAEEKSELENFEYNFKLIKKLALLRDLVSKGISVDDLYDINEVDPNTREKQMNDFGKKSVDDVLIYFKEKVLSLTATYETNSTRDSKKAGENGRQQLQAWKENSAWGIGYSSAFLTTALGGMQRRKFIVKSASSGVGKAICNDTLIPTTKGWKKVKDIRIGSYLFGRDGKPTKVVGVFPQEEQKEIWEVRFASGRIVKCCKDHLWSYYIEDEKELITSSTEELYSLCKKNICAIPLNKPIEYEWKDLQTPSKVLGNILHYNRNLTDKIFIPIEHLESSIEQRTQLFQALVREEKQFITRNRKLKDDFLSLVYSLGLYATVEERKDYNGSDFYIIYFSNERDRDVIVSIMPTNTYSDMTCFTVDNKDSLFAINDWCITHNTRTAIADICYACSPEYYDSKEKTWRRNPNGVDNGCLYIGTEMELGEEIDPILWSYIADVPEEHIKYNKYEKGEEERVLRAIDILSEQSNIWLEYLPDYNIDNLESVIAEHVIKHKVKYVFFDYIHTTPELIAEYVKHTSSRMSIREDQVLANLSKKLKEICRKYNISLNSCTQVSGDYKKAENQDASIVRGAKSIIDKVDVGMIASQPTEKELKLVEQIRRTGMGGNKMKPNLIYSIYKNRGGKYNRRKIWLYVDYDTMRVHDLFVTDYDYKIDNDIPVTYIEIQQDGKVKADKEKVYYDSESFKEVVLEDDRIDASEDTSKKVQDAVFETNMSEEEKQQIIMADELARQQLEENDISDEEDTNDIDDIDEDLDDFERNW